MSSRLDRNLVTMITGQAVEAFDTLFRILYMNSSFVDLQKVTMEPEPEPQYIPQPTIVHTPSATDVKKMHNPKYALVQGNHNPTPTNGHTGPNEIQIQENSKNPEVQGPKKKRQNRASNDSMEAPPIHPGLVNLEKAYMISYLPTWPQPDPPSDVIGFINIRDTSKPIQGYLQRSEMFETSQAIKFSSPVTTPKENLPEVAKPSQFTAKQEEVKTLTQEKAKTKESVGDRAEPKQSNAMSGDNKSTAKAPENFSSAPGHNIKSKNTVNTDDRVQLDTGQVAGHRTSPSCNVQTRPQPNSKASIPNIQKLSPTKQALPTNSLGLNNLPGPNTVKGGTTLRTQSVTRTQSSPTISCPTDTNAAKHTGRVLPQGNSCKQAVHTQPKNPHEGINVKTTAVNSHVSASTKSAVCSQPVSSTSLSENTSVTANRTSCSVTSSSTTLSPPHPTSSVCSSLTLNPPIPKPVMTQPIIKDSNTSDGQKPQELRLKNGASLQASLNERPLIRDVKKNSSDKESKILPLPQNNSTSKTGEQKDRENTGKSGEALQQKTIGNGASQGAKNEGTLRPQDNRSGLRSAAVINQNSKSDALITESTTQTGGVAAAQAGTKAPRNVLKACNSTPHMSTGSTQTNATGPPNKPGNLSFTAKQNTSSASSQLLQERGHTAEKSPSLRLFDMPIEDLRSATPLVRTLTPETCLPRTSTLDRRKPMSNISDRCMSQRTDSTLSTTSEEYYECSDSPFYESVSDQSVFFTNTTSEDRLSLTHAKTANPATVANSPTCIRDRNTSSNETQSLPVLPSVSSSSSLLDGKVIKGDEEKNDNNRRVMNEMKPKQGVAERRPEGASRGPPRRGSEERKSTAGTQGELLTERLESKQGTTGNTEPKKAPLEGGPPDKERAAHGPVSGPGQERRARQLSTRECVEQMVRTVRQHVSVYTVHPHTHYSIKRKTKSCDICEDACAVKI